MSAIKEFTEIVDAESRHTLLDYEPLESFTVNYNPILLHACHMIYGRACIYCRPALAHALTHANTRFNYIMYMIYFKALPHSVWYPGIYFSSTDWTWSLLVGKQCIVGNHLRCVYCPRTTGWTTRARSCYYGNIFSWLVLWQQSSECICLLHATFSVHNIHRECMRQS